MLTSSVLVRNLGQVVILSGLLTLTVCPANLPAADLSLPVTGNLVGSVVDAGGIPQMGVTVQLLNRYHQAIAKASSNAEGHFAFAALPGDSYSLRASLASFLPASREKITVKAGLDSVLQIHLATLFSSVEVAYMIPSAAMSDDWKWVLRSSAATRPINRYLPDLSTPDPDLVRERTPIFSETHAFLSVTGGDGGALDSDSSFSDFGTAFTLSTQFYGKNRLQVSGSYGQDAAATSPAFGVGAVYSRNESTVFGRPPEITFTAMQIAGLGGLGSLNSGSSVANSNLPSAVPLRSMSLSIYEVIDPSSGVHVEYGVTGESVDDMQHSSLVSPFARASLDTGKLGQWVVSYSDGGRPDQLLLHSPSVEAGTMPEGDSSPSLSSLQRLPQVSSRDSRLVLERTRAYELGYNKVSGSQTYALSTFSENVSNGRMSVAGDTSALLAPDVLSDTLSRTSVYNVGHYRRIGYMGSVDQQVVRNLEIGLAYGRMGGFTAQSSTFLDHAHGHQRFLEERNVNVASANVKTVVPRIGTRINADYGWVDSGTVVPRHIFTTQQASAAPGFNIYVRQPVPTFFGLPGRLELTADLRNLLSQGYLPLNDAAGRQVLIVQAPQSVRGGLNFTF